MSIRSRNGKKETVVELIVAVALLVVLDLAALRWGRDSRETGRGHFGAGGIVPSGHSPQRA